MAREECSPFSTDEFVRQLHSKRHDVMTEGQFLFFKTLITLNTGAIGFTISAKLFSVHQNEPGQNWMAIAFFVVGCLTALYSLRCLINFNFHLLIDASTYEIQLSKDKTQLVRSYREHFQQHFRFSALSAFCFALGCLALVAAYEAPQ